ncbi:glycerol-3-phosphate dehydrogenase/oxidase [Spongiibacter sp. KMU-158]|uniref:Glycerol-3-phosphate dehydrogenase/oxidase n=1 Tax=Spongiibacter pelagi TaxID=2760804 RepID=A0A927BXS4_9GAMM|nr:glycerol-3-phosphate dehydrogenase/oxidase [Spongiibacter pelagi]MBD2857518.1 glycerol-3-phosphate dehydrogenase/oxidase [Spongiibacter pelagi]
MSPALIETDIAVIGGGVHGTGIAQAAAAAGYNVAIFEKNHWASGTSRRSSKLIHGGLRYLETGQLPLVYHSLYERYLLLKNAPKLVKPVKFFIPIYKETGRRPWQIRAGLILYFFLSGGRKLGRFRKLKRSEWDQLDGINTQGLQAVFQYWDGQTDDKLLTEAVLRSAQSLGAQGFEQTELLSAKKNERGYLLKLEGPNGAIDCQCKVLVNAGGPWVNAVAERIETQVTAKPMELVRGSHILIDKKLDQGVFYMEAPTDGRAVFAMPWGDKALIGTTEVSHTEAPDDVKASDAEVQYLLHTFSHYFPGEAPKLLDAWAGLRVLPRSDENANKRDRDTFFLVDNEAKPSMVAVYGGKLTSYRHTSARVIDYIRAGLPSRTPVADTRSLPLND